MYPLLVITTLLDLCWQQATEPIVLLLLMKKKMEKRKRRGAECYSAFCDQIISLSFPLTTLFDLYEQKWILGFESSLLSLMLMVYQMQLPSIDEKIYIISGTTEQVHCVIIFKVCFSYEDWGPY